MSTAPPATPQAATPATKHFGVVVYSEPGIGKTVTIGMAMHDALWLTRAVGPESLGTTWGIKVNELHPRSLAEATDMIRRNRPKRVVLDDLGTWVSAWVATESKQYPDPRQMYQALKATTQLLIEAVNEVGADWVASLHETEIKYMNPPPRDPSGRPMLCKERNGQPDLPNGAGNVLHRSCTAMLRLRRHTSHQPLSYPNLADAGMPPVEFWGGLLGTVTTDWDTKDRYNILGSNSTGPANLGEYLRAAHYTITRPPEYAEALSGVPMENMVEMIATRGLQPVLDGKSPTLGSSFSSLSFDLIPKLNLPKNKRNWLLQDAYARAAYRLIAARSAT
jgi:hypothetical protein